MYVPVRNHIEREITRELFLTINTSLSHTTNYLPSKCIIHGHLSNSAISPMGDVDDDKLDISSCH